MSKTRSRVLVVGVCLGLCASPVMAARMSNPGTEHGPPPEWTITRIDPLQHSVVINGMRYRLAADVKVGLMLPCPIMVYAEGGRVFITTMRPSLIADFFPQADVSAVAGQVEDVLVGVIDTACKSM